MDIVLVGVVQFGDVGGERGGEVADCNDVGGYGPPRTRPGGGGGYGDGGGPSLAGRGRRGVDAI